MTTKVYGHSDDCVEIEGDVDAEFYDDDTRLKFDDGTILRITYANDGFWRIEVLTRGTLFVRVVQGGDVDDDYTDVAHFADGLKQAWKSLPASDLWVLVE